MGLSVALPVNKQPHCVAWWCRLPFLSVGLWRIYHLWIIHYSSIVYYHLAHSWCHLLVFMCNTTSHCEGCMYLAMWTLESFNSMTLRMCCCTFIFFSVFLFLQREATPKHIFRYVRTKHTSWKIYSSICQRMMKSCLSLYKPSCKKTLKFSRK